MEQLFQQFLLLLIFILPSSPIFLIHFLVFFDFLLSSSLALLHPSFFPNVQLLFRLASFFSFSLHCYPCFLLFALLLSYLLFSPVSFLLLQKNSRILLTPHNLHSSVSFISSPFYFSSCLSIFLSSPPLLMLVYVRVYC